MTSCRVALFPIALAVVAALTGCEANLTSGSAGSVGPAPEPTVAGVHLSGRTTVSNAAGSFSGVARDQATKDWFLLSGTGIAPNAKRIDLAPVGASVALEAAFKTAGGKMTLHGYGLKVLTDASPSGVGTKNGYSAFFEEPNRLDIYRESDGKFKDINDTRPALAIQDGKRHSLRVVVTHSAPSRIDITTFVDGQKASTAHDDRDVYTSGSWGLTNLSNSSVASVTVKPAVVSSR